MGEKRHSNTNMLEPWYEGLAAKNIVPKKYCHNKEDGTLENFDEFVERVSGIFSTPDLREAMRNSIRDADFFPAGRALYGAGSKGKFHATMSNCYVADFIPDSIEGIFDGCGKAGRTFSYGGGIGINLSKLRPCGSPVNNSAKTSTGACSYAHMFDAVAVHVGSNGRRSAMLIALDCHHPDIEEFLKLKQNNTAIQTANLSILFTDDFIRRVLAETEEEQQFTLFFESDKVPRVEKTINAREFFKEFCQSQYDFAEPGALFIDTLRRYNLLAGYPPDEYTVISTNPCVSGKTPILTDKGHVPIVERVGKKTTIWNGFEWSEVVPRITGRNQPMRLVTLSNGAELECTAYHKFTLADGRRVEANKLRVGDKLEKWNLPVIEGEEELENAYTMGFYSGDGTKGLRQICLYGDKEALVPYFTGVAYTLTQRKRIVLMLEEQFEKDFVPSCRYSVASRLEWLAGLIDSDGCLNSCEGSIAISSVDFGFLDNVRLMLSTLGVHSSIGIMHGAGYKYMPDGYGGEKEYYTQESYRLVISACNVMRLNALGIDTRRVPTNATPDRDAGRFITIKSVEIIPDEPVVYCFDEPKNHTGIFNGIMTAQCGEFAGNAWNSCNLGSINLYNMVEAPFTQDAFFDFDKFASAVKLGVTALDEILDYGYDMQPLQENKDCLLDWRAIGLGIMGLADMAIALNLVYGSEKFNNLLNTIGQEMLYNALKTSCELAKKFGAFGKFDAEKVLASPMFDYFRQSDDEDERFADLLQDIRLYGLRNGSLLSVAPTGSVATMANLSGGFEPHFARIYERTTHANVGDAKKRFKVLPLAIAHYLHHNGIQYNVDTVTDAELAELVPASINAHEVKAADKVQTQATLQKWIDNAISCTVNLPEEATVEDIFNAYITAWNSGCKGLTVFRNGCKRTAIMSTLDNKKGAAEEETAKKPQDVTYDSIRPRKREHFCDNIYTTRLPSGSYVRRTACIDKMYIHIARDNEGRLLDIFTNAGAGCASNRDTITRLTSLCIRSGQAIDEVARELEAAPCAACQSRIKEKDMKRSCGAALASALREEYTLSSVTEEPIHVEEDTPHVNTTPASPQENKNHSPFLKCPECGETAALPEAKCVTCQNCGWSKC